jgi:hypothetical protein
MALLLNEHVFSRGGDDASQSVSGGSGLDRDVLPVEVEDVVVGGGDPPALLSGWDAGSHGADPDDFVG